jgi:hypothetical protein
MIHLGRGWLCCYTIHGVGYAVVEMSATQDQTPMLAVDVFCNPTIDD